MAKNAIAKIDISQYPILATDMPDIGAVIAENMGGEQVSPSDLPRIKVPSGGATVWAVPDGKGDEDAAKTIDGIIVSIQMRRAYWPSSDPTGEPPSCAAPNWTYGVGMPGGVCVECLQDQFGTSVKTDGSQGAGKACKQSKLLFVLMPGKMLPVVVNCPSSSLKAMRQWQLSLTQPYYTVVSSLALTKEKSKDGIEYASIVPRVVEPLPTETVEQIRAYATSLQGVFSGVEIEREPAEGREV